MLSDICTKVYVVQNLDFLTGEQALQNSVNEKENIEVILGTTVAEILGDTEFKGLALDKNGERTELLVDGVFVAIGQQPENEPFKSNVKLNDYGYVISGEDCLPETTESGIFVAGDCRTKAIRQVTTATADGAVAALAACRVVDSLK